MEPTIFLDMDGVCCDLEAGLCRVCGWDREPPVRDSYHLHEYIGMSRRAMWGLVESRGEAFWTGLCEFPWFRELYESLRKLGNVVFCSTPTESAHSFSGKITWLQQRFGRDFRDYVFTPHKRLLSTCPGSVLVDDWVEVVGLFLRSGGRAVLFPARSNCRNHEVGRIDLVLQEVEEALRNGQKAR